MNCSMYCLKTCRTQILTANRQLYSEAREILYSNTVWHINFKSLGRRINPEITSDASLRAFRSQSHFRFIQYITVGVMFITGRTPDWTSDDCKRLAINRKLLNFICEILLQAQKLLTLKLLWHDRIEHGDWKEKRDCLTELARLPETVKCAVCLGAESIAVHFPHRVFNSRRSLSVQEQAAKADLNRHLRTVREQYQAHSLRNSLDELEDTS